MKFFCSELLFPFFVLDAVDASNGTGQTEIAQLREEIKKIEGLQQKLEDSQKKHCQHLGDLETKSNTMQNDVKKVRFYCPNDIL